MAKTRAELDREIRAFVATQKMRGGGYRDATGNYSPELYDKHNQLLHEREGMARAAKATAKMARSLARAAAKRWRVETGEGKIAYVATKSGKAGERQAGACARLLMREHGGAYFTVAP